MKKHSPDLITIAAQKIVVPSVGAPILLAAQHISYTTAQMFSAIIDQGFPPENIYLMGKCYSSNPIAIKLLEKLGIRIAEQSSEFDSYQDYDSFFLSKIREFFIPLLEKLDQKFIILDDGGALLQMAIEFNQNIGAVVAIEQTSSGYHRAFNASFLAPVINVARSMPKLEKESLFIARMVVKNIKNVIESVVEGSLLKILVLGAGVIGNGIYKMLSEEYEVDLWDVIAEKGTLPGMVLDDYLGNYDIIIGCTGNCSIPHAKHFLLKKGVMLISASSSDREFDSVFIRRGVDPYYNCHKSIHVQDINLINSGFPINFDDTFLDSLEFQFTRALLLTSIGQALELLKLEGPLPRGFIPLKNTDDIESVYAETFSCSPLSRDRSIFEMRFPLFQNELLEVNSPVI